MMNIGASKARKPINHRKVAVIPRCGGGREGGGYDDEGKKGGSREGNKWPSSSLIPPPIEVLRRGDFRQLFQTCVSQTYCSCSLARSSSRLVSCAIRETVSDLIGFAIYLDITVFHVFALHVVKRNSRKKLG